MRKVADWHNIKTRMAKQGRFEPFWGRGVLAAAVCIWAASLPTLLIASDAKADMCLNGGGVPDDKPAPDSGKDGGNDTLSTLHKSRRKVGTGLLMAASISTVWLSLRRSRDRKHRS